MSGDSGGRLAATFRRVIGFLSLRPKETKKPDEEEGASEEKPDQADEVERKLTRAEDIEQLKGDHTQVAEQSGCAEDATQPNLLAAGEASIAGNGSPVDHYEKCCQDAAHDCPSRARR